MKQVIATAKKIVASREYESRIERYQSPLRMRAVPFLTIMAASMLTALPFFTEGPLLPPMGLMMLLAWRLMRPGLLPVWAGLPLGLFDDLFSGQPFGSAGLLWSLAMVAIELIDMRAAWRDHGRDWAIASLLLVAALCAGVGIQALVERAPSLWVIMPQIIASILLYPLVVRVCAIFDRWRLAT